MRKLVIVDPVELKNSRTFACVLCTERWPERQMYIQDGIESDHRCPNDFEPEGGTLARDLDRAAATEVSTAIIERFAPPSKFPYPLDDWASARTLFNFSPEPRTLTKGGAAAVLTINGSGLASDDTVAYGHAGITDSVAPALTPVTYDSEGNAESPYYDVLVLTVAASSGVPAGLFSLTYEGVEYQNTFDVRA